MGVSVNGEQEQPRVLLLSVPYALKAADAETIGGLPPSAFVLAHRAATGNRTKTAPTAPIAKKAGPLANTQRRAAEGALLFFFPRFLFRLRFSVATIKHPLRPNTLRP